MQPDGILGISGGFVKTLILVPFSFSLSGLFQVEYKVYLVLVLKAPYLY